jgi:hypothetical protein
MIGRTKPLKPFETIRWAREQAREKDLKQLDAHVLLILATYANELGCAWPGIKTIALDCGLSVATRVDPKTGKVSHTNSAVSAALGRLEDAQLIWTTKGRNGRSSTRELLFDGNAPSSALTDDGNTDSEAVPSSALTDDGSVPLPAPEASPSSAYADDPVIRPHGDEVPEELPVPKNELPNNKNGQSTSSAYADDGRPPLSRMTGEDDDVDTSNFSPAAVSFLRRIGSDGYSDPTTKRAA